MVKNYDAILPSTIARKKRESERKIPLRKRTAPVDMRQSRGNRISVGGVNQFFAQKNVKSPEKSSEPLPPPPPPPVLASPPPPPPLEEKPEPVVEAPPLPPPPPPPAAVDPDLPPRPTFKEPPPEDDDLPPRPTFKEPPPEPEDDAAPPMPKFVDPPPEDPEVGDVAAPAQSPPLASVSPVPSEVKRPSSSISIRSNQSKVSSRSPTPPKEDPAKITRSVSGGVKGPRGARGPRPAGGGTVSSMVSNLNRNSVTSSTSNRSASPSYKRLSGSPNRRPSSVLGRSAAFSRRTMASDAEDDVVDKK